MKQLICLALLSFALSCGNETTDTKKTESTTIAPPVENVEGNLPDSNSSINLNKQLPVDSSGLRDSTQPR